MSAHHPPPSGARRGPFISYAREDADRARALSNALRARDREPWGDWRIDVSADWKQEIDSAIDATPAFVFLISPDSIRSSGCLDELQHALVSSKRIIPVVCRDVDEEDVAPPLRRLQWLFIREAEPPAAEVDRLVSVMDADPDWVHAHTRLLVRAREWELAKRNPSLLLRGSDLKDSEQWLANDDAERTPRWVQVQKEYLLAGRRAEVSRQRRRVASLTLALIVTSGLALYAWRQSRIADHQRDVALSRLLASVSTKLSAEPTGELDLALLLAVAAQRLEPTPQAQASLFDTLLEANRIDKFVRAPETLASLALSPDGGTIATGDVKGTITLWDRGALRPRATPRQGRGFVTGLSFSPDGATLAAAVSGRIVLWELRQQSEPRALDGEGRKAERVAWHPDGRTLYSAGPNQAGLLAWDVAAGTPRSAMSRDRLMAFAVSPDGTTLASAGDHHAFVRLWDAASGTQRAELQGHAGPVRALAFSRDGTLLATGGKDSAVIVWDVASGTRRTTLEGVTGRIDALAFSADGQRLAVGSDNRNIVLWDVAHSKPLELLRGHDNSVMSLHFTADGTTLVSQAFDDTFIVWNAAMPRHRAHFTGHEGDVKALAVSPEGQVLASGGDDGTIRWWDLRSGRPRSTLAEHRGAVKTLAFAPDGRVLASGSDDDKRILLWDVATGGRVKELRANGPVKGIAISPNGALLASVHEGDSAIRLWDLTKGVTQPPLRGHDGSPNVLRFTRDGRRLVSGGDAVRVWDLAAHKEVDEPMGAGGGSVADLAVSPDGTKVFVSGHMPGRLLLWNIGDTKAPIELDGMGSHGGKSVAYSPDGTMLAHAAGELGTTVVLWDIARAMPRALLENRATTLSMAFTPDAKRLFTGHYGGAVLSWDVDVPAWPARACEIANRNLSPSEWRAIVGDELPYQVTCPGLPVLER